MSILRPNQLPRPETIITLDLSSIIQTFQNLSYIGELRQRWEEIKKLKDYQKKQEVHYLQ